MWRFKRILAALAVIATAHSTQAIRVYEGTNLGRPAKAQMNSSATDVYTFKKSSNLTELSVPQRRAESRSDNPNLQSFAGPHLKFSKELKQTPNLYKVKLTQQGYLQFLRYLADIPPLREYTMCVWFTSKNLSHTQPLFSYGMQDEARILGLWYEPKDATIRMSIRDDLVFKVPAIVQIDKWHHVCQSWNGIYGEWIVFFDGSKIGSGHLYKYKGTYVPGGGEVVVGHEPANFHSGVDDGIEGEVFGFNLVDEAAQDDFKLSIPEPLPKPVPTPYVPPFKTLPPMKKSYQEIKAFIKALPSEPVPYATRIGGKRPGPPASKPNKVKPPARPPRNKPRPHYKPVKAVIYEREDRHLRYNQLNKKVGLLPPPPPPPKHQQQFDENYSVHTYRGPKIKAGNYEIYEIHDEEESKRKTRQNFNIYTARQANNLYAMKSRTRQMKKPVYHFEGKIQKGSRRSLDVGAANKPKIDILEPKTPIDFIPVYEIIEDDFPLFRRKRDAGDDLTTDFRPLPKIPDGFINLFAGTQTKAEMDHKLSQFFPNRTEQVTTQAPVPSHLTEKALKMRNDVFDTPLPVQVRRNMIVNLKDLERRPGATSGTELVKRSYAECVAERGSPVKDKDRLVISWAETPVRIYGGAVVTTALNICGHF